MSDSSSEGFEIDSIGYRPQQVEKIVHYGKSGGLTHTTIENIIRQKEEYFKYKRKQEALIWKDSEFRPGPLLDKIADNITANLVKNAANLLDSTCNSFIDCLVQSEFFPEEVEEDL